MLEEWTIANLFVGGSLLLFALTLATAGRAGPERVLLAVFLVLVGLNYVALAVALPSGDVRFAQVAYLALALDPYFLLAFATLYPYPRRGRGTSLLLGGLAAAGLAGVAAVVFWPERTVPVYTTATPFSPGNVLLVGILATGYAAAWVASLRASARAPTPELARRARWLVVAIGVATVPRLAVLHRDFRIVLPTPGLTGDLASLLGTHALTLLPAGALVAAGLLVGGERARRPVLAVGAVTLALVAADAALYLARDVLPTGFASALPFALRWLVFAAILVHGMLWVGAVELHRAERAYALLGAGVALLLAALFTAGAPGLALVAAPLAGAAAYVLVRRVIWRIAPHEGRAADALEVFHASLEAAYARGTPDLAARDALDRERRRLGVSPEAARALEHVVARRARAHARHLREGDEPMPGVIVRKTLGHGSQSTVVAAERVATGERLVLKEIRIEGDPARARRALLDETRALRRLRHPHVVPLLDVHLSGGRYLLVMPDVDARPLREVRGLDEADVRRIGEQVLDALGAAHAAGVVHRDVKPDNVLLAADGRAYLADFGIATSGAPADPDGTLAPGEAPRDAGTPAYMAPEVARGAPATPASDLYSLALVLYETLTGRRARDVRGLAPLDALVAAAQGRVDVDDAPEGWRGFFARALDADPARRHSTADAMKRALREVALTPGTRARSDRP